MARRSLQILYTGRVQGVGFRYSTKTLANGFDVTGVVRNLPDGRVELQVEGEEAELAEFQNAIRESEVGRFIRQEEARWGAPTGNFKGFEIVR